MDLGAGGLAVQTGGEDMTALTLIVLLQILCGFVVGWVLAGNESKAVGMVGLLAYVVLMAAMAIQNIYL